MTAPAERREAGEDPWKAVVAMQQREPRSPPTAAPTAGAGRSDRPTQHSTRPTVPHATATGPSAGQSAAPAMTNQVQRRADPGEAITATQTAASTGRPTPSPTAPRR